MVHEGHAALLLVVRPAVCCRSSVLPDVPVHTVVDSFLAARRGSDTIEYANDLEGTAFARPESGDPLGASPWNLNVGRGDRGATDRGRREGAMVWWGGAGVSAGRLLAGEPQRASRRGLRV